MELFRHQTKTAAGQFSGFFHQLYRHEAVRFHIGCGQLLRPL